jgi:asparagine synthase (glutamine-hydrolysing)
MAATVRHRGPDDAGVYLDRDFGAGFRRLSILDLSPAGHQPMTTPDGRWTIVFNGEIYNFKELREKYCAGVKLRSTSDTEVLLQVLAQRGKEALSELRGMFALALWDTERRRLLLARDPFGKKPLYFAERGTTFLFASEIKALLSSPAIGTVEPDRAALAKYFLYEYVPGPATGFAGIRQLLPGHVLEVTEQGVTTQAWWQPAYEPKLAVPEQEAAARFDELLRQAVARRMIADVPVGLLLSGGIDSTTIGWYMREASSAPIHSFSISFAERTFNEASYARQAAASLGTEHHDLRFGLKEFHEAVAETTPLMDVPFGDASLLPTYTVSKLARSQITVALDGDGSDELLGGYGTFQAAELAEKLPRLWQGVWQGMAAAAQLLPTNYRDFSFDFKVKSFLRGLGEPLPYRNQVWLGSFTPAETAGLLQPAWRLAPADLTADIARLVPQLKSLDAFDAVSLMTVHHYLANDILVKLDRASMFVSLEARTPFLDVDAASYVMRLPAGFKRNKYLLKKVMRGRIPDAIIDRPKKGFGIPLGWWLKGPLYEWASSVLEHKKLAAHGILNPAPVRRLLAEHRHGKADHRKKLWTLLAWQLWYDAWLA